jgi:hypothetical protein
MKNEIPSISDEIEKHFDQLTVDKFSFGIERVHTT